MFTAATDLRVGDVFLPYPGDKPAWRVRLVAVVTDGNTVVAHGEDGAAFEMAAERMCFVLAGARV